MNEEIYAQTSKDLTEVREKIAVAKDLVKALRDAGENTSDVEPRLRELEAREGRWTRMLAARKF